MLKTVFDFKLFISLFLAFIIFTVIGTLSHEGGHYIVAKSFGYTADVNYMATSTSMSPISAVLDSMYNIHSEEIETGKNYEGKDIYNDVLKNYDHQGLWIIAGGPLQTTLTGCIGLALLWFQRKKIILSGRLDKYQWLCVFLSLFWLRQSANLVVWFLGYFIKGEFSTRADEIKLAESFGFSQGFLIIITAIIGFAILAYITLKIIPINQRLTFLLGGFVGGICGYISWMYWLGPIILP